MKDGAKVTCWSWWIWPAQFRNESSSTSKKWSVKVSEAAEFVEDDELRERWVEIVTVTLRQMQLQFAASASAWFRDRRVGDGGHCVWIHEVQLGFVGVVVGVRVRDGYRV